MDIQYLQNIFNTPNHIYKITKDIDLQQGTLNLPQGCTLDFQGGTITNGTITGLLENTYVLPEWFGAKGDGVTDDRVAIQTAINISKRVKFSKKTYRIGSFEYTTGQQGNLMIPHNIELLGNKTHFILDGHGMIFTPFNYGKNSNIKSEYTVKGVNTISSNVSYGSNTIEVEHVEDFQIGDKIIIRGEDSNLSNLDYEECKDWIITEVKDMNQTALIIDDNIPFSIDLTKCNQSGGISSPIMNGTVMPLIIDHIKIDDITIDNGGVSGGNWRFYACENITMTNIRSHDNGIVFFKLCQNIILDNIKDSFNNNDRNMSVISTAGVYNLKIGNLYVSEGQGNTNNNLRLINLEGSCKNISVDNIDFYTTKEYSAVHNIIIGKYNLSVQNLSINCQTIDAASIYDFGYADIGTVSITGTKFINPINVFSNSTKGSIKKYIVKYINGSDTNTYIINTNNIISKKSFAIDGVTGHNHIDFNILASANLAVVGLTSNKPSTIQINNTNDSNSGFHITLDGSNGYINTIFFLKDSQQVTKKGFNFTDLKLYTNETISEQDPLIVTMYFAPVIFYRNNTVVVGNFLPDGVIYNTIDKDYPFSLAYDNNVYKIGVAKIQ